MSVPTGYFDRLYEAAADPWRLATRWYEARKYALTLASLPRERYRRGFEPGCSVGVLTDLLAARCDGLISTDVAAAAVAATQRRVAHHRHVDVRQLRIPLEWPAGAFDLIVLSEIGYYLSAGELQETVRRSVDVLDGDGTIVAVHWRHPLKESPLTGDSVHAVIRADQRLDVTAHYEESDFLIDVLVPSSSTSTR
jgi:hypothetical protein